MKILGMPAGSIRYTMSVYCQPVLLAWQCTNPNPNCAYGYDVHFDAHLVLQV